MKKCYISVPNKSDWTHIKIQKPQEYNSYAWRYCIAERTGDSKWKEKTTRCLEKLKSEIQNYYDICESKDRKFSFGDTVYWVYVPTQSDLRLIGVKKSTKVEMKNMYACNSFKSKEEAEGLRELIVSILSELGSFRESNGVQHLCK